MGVENGALVGAVRVIGYCYCFCYRYCCLVVGMAKADLFGIWGWWGKNRMNVRIGCRGIGCGGQTNKQTFSLVRKLWLQQ